MNLFFIWDIWGGVKLVFFFWKCVALTLEHFVWWAVFSFSVSWGRLVGANGCAKVWTFLTYQFMIFSSWEFILQLKGFWCCYSLWFCFFFISGIHRVLLIGIHFMVSKDVIGISVLGRGGVRIGLFYVCFWFCFALS